MIAGIRFGQPARGRTEAQDMRVMEIPGFPRKIEIPDLHNFIRTRLSQTVVMLARASDTAARMHVLPK